MAERRCGGWGSGRGGARPRAATGRLLFVDNIRVFLTVLVIMHHLTITYAGTGSWYYLEGRQDAVVDALGGWFCAVNQSYFMGLFLLISAYFIPGSYDRKGPGRFTKDRLIRLGIPLAVFSWVVNPLFCYWFFHWSQRDVVLELSSRAEYFAGGAIIGQGPLWFVEVLLIFSLVYVVWRLLAPRAPLPSVTATPFPRDRTMALFALGLGVAAALLRIPFAIDAYWFAPLEPAVRLLRELRRAVRRRAARLPARLAAEPPRQDGTALAAYRRSDDPAVGADGRRSGGDRQRPPAQRRPPLAVPGLRPLGGLRLRQPVHRGHLPVPPSPRPAGQARRIPGAERLHRLSHPCPDDRDPGLGDCAASRGTRCSSGRWSR